MKKVYWNTEIYKKYSNLLSINLFAPVIFDFGERLVFIDTNYGMEILEDADQIKAAGEYFLMSSVIMQVPEELVEIYELKELNPDIPYGSPDDYIFTKNPLSFF